MSVLLHLRQDRKEIRMKKIIFLAVVSFWWLQTSAYAAWMSGVIKDVDSANRVVTLERAGAELQEAYSKEIQVKILENAKLKNMTTLDELQTGQEVKIDARANKEQGFWDANYIELIDADADVQASEAGAPVENPKLPQGQQA